MEELASQEKDNEILLKLLDVKNMQIRNKIGRILVNREDILPYVVYEKIADMKDSLTIDKAVLKAYRNYKTVVPSYMRKYYKSN